MSTHHDDRERLEELLVRRTMEGLGPADEAELDRLLAASDDIDPERFDEAAAWFFIGSATDTRPLPDEVAQRVIDRLERASTDMENHPVVPPRQRPPRKPVRQYGGWLAAAAALVLAVAGWWPELQGPDIGDPAAARDQLIANAQDLVRVEWSNTEHPLAQQLAGGYVVWSHELQRGYMTFRGMPDNDPGEHQYQLWVFDAARSEKYPVDGGVFDANDGGEVVIPIRARLPIEKATLFAVTLEPPGGVVVSDRDPILWVAKPGGDATG